MSLSITAPDVGDGSPATWPAEVLTTPTAELSTATAAELSGDQIAALRGAILILARRLRQQQAGDELSPSESAVMGRLGRGGPMTPGWLARSEHVQPPSMTRIIELLEGRGFVRRDPDPGDRRQVLVSRTASGDDFAERSRMVRTAWLTQQLGRLEPPDQRAIAAATAALTRLAELA